MSILEAELQPLAEKIQIDELELRIFLRDGRELLVPLSWFPSLSGASTEELQDFEILGDGEGVHWPKLDEDLSVKGILLGNH